MTQGTDDDNWLEGDGPATDPTVVDKHGLATFLGMTLKDIDRLLRDGLPIHGERRRGAAARFRVPAVVQWLLARRADPMDAAKRRSIEAVARKREAEAGKLEDRFVEIDVVESAIKDGVAKFQAELMSIPARCPPDVRDVVKVEIAGAINRLAEIRP